MPYTAAELADALTASTRRWSFRYDRVQPTGDRNAIDVVKCSVSYNDLADNVQRVCQATLPTGVTFNLLRDALRPYARLLMPDGDWQEWPMGTFYLETDTRRWKTAAGGGLIQTQGWDRAVKTLLDSKTLDRYVVAAGSNVLNTVRAICGYAGLSLFAMPLSTVVLPGAMEWDPGTPWIRVVNDLLTAINYRPLTGTPLGSPTTQEYRDPTTGPIVWNYTVDAKSVVRRGIDTVLDLANVPNAWVAFVSEPDRPVLRSSLTNSNLQDPLSTVGRNRTIVDVIAPDRTKGAVDQATLDALVMRAAQDARSAYEQAKFSTGLMPFHSGGDIVTLDYGLGAIRYRSHTWDLELEAGAAMQHQMRRVVTL